MVLTFDYDFFMRSKLVIWSEQALAFYSHYSGSAVTKAVIIGRVSDMTPIMVSLPSQALIEEVWPRSDTQNNYLRCDISEKEILRQSSDNLCGTIVWYTNTQKAFHRHN